MSIHSDQLPMQEDKASPLHEQETIVQPMGPPPTQPPSRPPRGTREHWLIGTLLVILVVILALGSVFVMQLANRPAAQPTPGPTRVVTATQVPTTGTTPAPTTTTTPVPPSGVYQPINALWMSDATSGWASTTTHLILRTTNGGKTWQNVTPPYPAGSPAQGGPVFASLNGSVAWVAVFEPQQPDGTVPNVVFRTVDGGQTWQQAMLPSGILGASQVQFVNAQDGWVLASFGGGGAGSEMVNLYRSTDGGQTWSLVARTGSSPTSIPTVGKKTGMAWASPTVGWITGTIAASQNTVYLYRTQDAGVTWRPQALTLPAVQAILITQPPVFFSATEGLLPVTFYNATGTSLDVYATHDSGATWNGTSLLANVGSAWDFLSMQQGWVVGASGTTLDETSDGGLHWTTITPTANFTHISQLEFVSAQVGWAINAATPDVPVLLKTSDGGQTWVQVSPAPTAFKVTSVDLVVNPTSIAGKPCGSSATFRYLATFHIPAGTNGGTIHFSYTLNNGRSQTFATVSVGPGVTSATYSFTSSGTLPADHTYPGIAQVMVTSPNMVLSPQVQPSGVCVQPTPTPPPSTSQPISTLWMSDATTGWATTMTNQIVRTTDGARSWQNVTPLYPSGSTVQVAPTIDPLGGSIAWAAVSEKLSNGSIALVVFRTKDGGHTWQQAALPLSPQGLNLVVGMQFLTAQNGWLLASPGGRASGEQDLALFRTTDGGQSWSLVARTGNTLGTIPLQGDKTGMGWASATVGWITGTRAPARNTIWLYRTQDGGRSWQPQSLPLPPVSAQAVITTEPPVFFSSTEGLLPVSFTLPEGYSFAVYATHDGGATWSRSTMVSTPGNARTFLSMQQWWVVGTGGTLVQTSDGGQHWTVITPNTNFQHIAQLDFVSAQEGWAISTASPETPVLLKTMDGGQTWVQVSPGKPADFWSVISSPNAGTGFNQLNSLTALSAINIWAVGYTQNSSGTSTLTLHWNGGSWQVVSSPNAGTYNELAGVTALSPTNIWAVGYAQNSSGRFTLIEHYWNGNWQIVSSPNARTGSSQLTGVVALSPTNIWAVGYTASGNNAYRHTLIEHWNGTHWQIISSPNPGTVYNVLSGVTALSTGNIWAIGYLTNADGIAQTLTLHWNGSHWQVVSSPNVGAAGNALNGVAAVSPTNIWAVGFYRTASGATHTLIEQWNGTHWQVVSSPNVGTGNNALNSVAVVSATNLWAVGASANSMSDATHTLIEQWNGTNWQVVSSPNAGTGNNVLNGVVALSITNLWAAGASMSNGKGQTLTEQYS